MTTEAPQPNAPQSDNLADPIEANPKRTTWRSIAYDLCMLGLICFDLALIAVDAILMSGIGEFIAGKLNLSLVSYREGNSFWSHHQAVLFGSVITVFLIAEVGIRWFIAIVTKRYYRWFFFPFVHWYEVISCFPQFRVLRLLRVVVTGYRLYQMGYNVIPKSWIKTAKFYYDMVLEEISDRVIVIALNSVENELKESKAHQTLVQNLINENRTQIQAVVGELLQQEVAPALKQHAMLTREGVGNAVYRALANVPELNKYLRLIPIAGKMIESEIQSIGQAVADSITDELLKPFYQAPYAGKTTNENFAIISEAVGNISADHKHLEELVSSLVFSSLATIKEQIQVQQWREKQATSLDIDNT